MKVDTKKCTGCGICIADCGTQVLQMDKTKQIPILAFEYCSECGHCMAVCPQAAISFENFPDFQSEPIQEQSITLQAFLTLSKQRRSYRSFQSTPIPRDLLDKIVKSTKFAPTGCNAQELEYTIITNSKLIHTIAEAMHKKFKIAAWLTQHFPVKQWMRITQTPEKAARNIDGPARLTDSFERGKDLYLRDAPAMIIIHTGNKMEMMHLDAGIAGHHINLACETVGLGCCWIGFHSKLATYFPKIRKLSLIPRKHKVLGTLIVGYPKVKYLRTCPRYNVNINFTE